MAKAELEFGELIGGGSSIIGILKFINMTFSAGSNRITIPVDKKPKSAIWITGNSSTKDMYLIDIENGKAYEQHGANQFIDESSYAYFSDVTDSSCKFNWSGYSTSNNGQLVLFDLPFDSLPPTVVSSL